ncbi:MAG TPA: hypothetical protein PKD90_03405 [Phnomibacter sp.]|nr:hypothetical protein [Phnomibacter sp.]
MGHNLRRLPLIALFTLLAFMAKSGFGQRIMINGHVVDSLTKANVSSASVRNVLSGFTTLSNKAGRFAAEVQAGSVLAIAAVGYYTDTININAAMVASGQLTVVLKPLPSTLPGVVVTPGLSQYQRDSIERRRNFVEEAGKITYGAVGRANDLGFGVALNLNRFSKREKNKRRAYTLFEIMEQEAYINYRWTEDLVYKYTKLDDDKLYEFMRLYRPTEEWLRENLKEEDMVYYINKQLKRYLRGINEK